MTGAVNGWVDAYTAWGLSLEDGSLSRLLTPAPHKEPITNKNVISNGMSVVQTQFYKDVRQVTLEVHITASTEQAFYTQYKDFCAKVLDAGLIHLKHAYDPNVVYNMLYVDCTQFAKVQEMAKFTLSLEEPRPDIRTESGIIAST